jgi:hypothetical protein
MRNFILKGFLLLGCVFVTLSLMTAKKLSAKAMESSVLADEAFDGPGDRKKNRYRKSTNSKNFSRRLRSPRGQGKRTRVAGRASTNRISGGRFQLRGSGASNSVSGIGNNGVKRKNKYKYSMIRKSRKEKKKNYTQDRTGRRSNSFLYRK